MSNGRSQPPGSGGTTHPTPQAKPSLENYILQWASRNISAAAMREDTAAPQAPWVYARYRLGDLAKALQEAGYAK